jgi:hypothetical protein
MGRQDPRVGPNCQTVGSTASGGRQCPASLSGGLRIGFLGSSYGTALAVCFDSGILWDSVTS